MEYSVRIDIPALQDPDGFKVWLEKHCAEYTIAYETVDGANPHYQGYLKVTQYKDPTLRKRLTELLQVRGNRAYSLTKLKKSKEELLQYVCKDGDVRYTTLTEEALKLYKDLGSSRKQEVAKAREKKEAKKSVLQRLKDELRLEDVESREEVAEKVVRWYAESEIAFPSDHILRNYINTLYIGVLRRGERYEAFLKYYPKFILGSGQAYVALERECRW